MNMAYYLRTEDSFSNDNEVRCYRLKATNINDAVLEAKEHLLDRYAGEDRDSWGEREPFREFYVQKAEVLCVSAVQQVDFHGAIVEGRAAWKKRQAEAAEEAERQEYERLKDKFGSM